MAEYFNNDLDDIVEDYYDTGDFDYFDNEFVLDDQQAHGNDSELENVDDLGTQKNDTSASEYRNGKDMQGIPWERLIFSRDEYRQMRLKMYMNYENTSIPRDGLEKPSLPAGDFSPHAGESSRRRRLDDLRNLIWATSKHDVYMVQNYSVMHWSSLLRRGSEVVNGAGKVVPTQVIENLKGHLDYSFASAWHPDGHILATGSQDKTCRLWDVRNTSESLAVLKGKIGAIRGITFSTDGRLMAMAEPADFVHVYDAKADYWRAQEIDLFGEIAGLSFSPDADVLFVGVADRTYGSLLEFSRRKHDHYLNAFL
ncbi:hypothetical protein BHE74_00025063 [Ensete ventricosum]|nr:hypothetical protein GW17_00009027 [Ensete ventricosum]RWW67479.1 hypothetical protein BHE74_00025063 [Ensete ventricosum]